MPHIPCLTRFPISAHSNLGLVLEYGTGSPDSTLSPRSLKRTASGTRKRFLRELLNQKTLIKVQKLGLMITCL